MPAGINCPCKIRKQTFGEKRSTLWTGGCSITGKDGTNNQTRTDPLTATDNLERFTNTSVVFGLLDEVRQIMNTADKRLHSVR